MKNRKPVFKSTENRIFRFPILIKLCRFWTEIIHFYHIFSIIWSYILSHISQNLLLTRFLLFSMWKMRICFLVKSYINYIQKVLIVFWVFWSYILVKKRIFYLSVLVTFETSLSNKCKASFAFCICYLWERIFFVRQKAFINGLSLRHILLYT